MNNNKTKEIICRKLRATVKEYGQAAINNVIIVGPDNDLYGPTIGGHTFIGCPSGVSEYTLSGCSFEIARFFENII